MSRRRKTTVTVTAPMCELPHWSTVYRSLVGWKRAIKVAPCRSDVARCELAWRHAAATRRTTEQVPLEAAYRAIYWRYNDGLTSSVALRRIPRMFSSLNLPCWLRCCMYLHIFVNRQRNLKLIFYRAMLCIRGTSHGPVSVSVCPSVSVCLSQVGVLLKRQNVGSHKQHHTIAQGL